MKIHEVYNRLFIDHKCALCTTRTPQGPLCEGCHADLPWLLHPCPRCALPLQPGSQPNHCPHCQHYPSSIDHTLAPFHYQFPLDRLIPRIKYQRKPVALGWLAEVMAQFISSMCDDQPSLLLPVPMHLRSELVRGFNQSALLAEQLSRHLQIPLDPSLLSKRRHTPRQGGLSAEQRRTNLELAFALRRPPPAHVALIDDVMTTGSTASELASLLKAGGAQRVDLWVIARTPPPQA